MKLDLSVSEGLDLARNRLGDISLNQWGSAPRSELAQDLRDLGDLLRLVADQLEAEDKEAAPAA